MSRRTAFRLAWSLCAFVLLLQVLSALLIFLGWSAPLPQGCMPWRYRACGTGYTANMMRFVVALVFIAIAVWLGFSILPNMIANMLSGTP